uniref:Putative secreted protein n=1 Tax=Anopheles darlingi TaxID=43151 RepID=A0A2M4DQN9_ANODA
MNSTSTAIVAVVLVASLAFLISSSEGENLRFCCKPSVNQKDLLKTKLSSLPTLPKANCTKTSSTTKRCTPKTFRIESKNGAPNTATTHSTPSRRWSFGCWARTFVSFCIPIHPCSIAIFAPTQWTEMAANRSCISIGATSLRAASSGKCNRT